MMKMNKIFRINDGPLQVDLAILIARISITALMLTHGLPKLVMLLSGDPVQFPAVFGLSAGLSLGLTVFAEVVASLFILAGLATRLAVIPLMIAMLVAVFYIHGGQPFVEKEIAVLYLLVYLVLFLTGSGRYSLDYLVGRKMLQPALARGKGGEPPLPAYR